MRSQAEVDSKWIDININVIVLAAVGIFVLSKVQKLFRGLKAVGYLPGIRIPFQPLAVPAAIFPSSWWNVGVLYAWEQRFSLYKKFQQDTISVVPFLSGSPGVWTSDLYVIRQILATGGAKSSFGKSEEEGKWINHWGDNIITSEGDAWRKHRRIVGPAFGNDLNELVWNKSIETYHEMAEAEGWTDKASVNISYVQKLTFKFALLLICKAGFGLPFTWEEPPAVPGGGMSLQESIRIVADSIIPIVSFPRWLLALPIPGVKKMARADSEMLYFLKSQVAQKRNEVKIDGGSSAKDIFTLLVTANEQETGKLKLADDELVGNIFIMIFAGHESTAHTLAGTLAYLSLHSELQDEVVEQIQSVVEVGRDPLFSDYPKLDKVLAAFYETLRMLPAAYVSIREAQEDTILDIPNSSGEGTTRVPILKGTKMVVDHIGLQYNEKYYDEPGKYKPSRWHGISNLNESEAFTAFGLGPRACIGRKFATTEGVCFLTMLLRDWRVEPVFLPGETKEGWRERVLCSPKVLLTLGLFEVPMKFSRRNAN